MYVFQASPGVVIVTDALRTVPKAADHVDDVTRMPIDTAAISELFPECYGEDRLAELQVSM